VSASRARLIRGCFWFDRGGCGATGVGGAAPRGILATRAGDEGAAPAVGSGPGADAWRAGRDATRAMLGRGASTTRVGGSGARTPAAARAADANNSTLGAPLAASVSFLALSPSERPFTSVRGVEWAAIRPPSARAGDAGSGTESVGAASRSTRGGDSARTGLRLRRRSVGAEAVVALATALGSRLVAVGGSAPRTLSGAAGAAGAGSERGSPTPPGAETPTDAAMSTGEGIGAGVDDASLPVAAARATKDGGGSGTPATRGRLPRAGARATVGAAIRERLCTTRAAFRAVGGGGGPSGVLPSGTAAGAPHNGAGDVGTAAGVSVNGVATSVKGAGARKTPTDTRDTPAGTGVTAAGTRDTGAAVGNGTAGAAGGDAGGPGTAAAASPAAATA
jgi:hypothetical protein